MFNPIQFPYENSSHSNLLVTYHAIFLPVVAGKKIFYALRNLQGL